MLEKLGDRFRSLTSSGQRKIARRTAARSAVANLRPSVVVTGASRGIGRELAKRFFLIGKDVVLIARNAQALTAASEDFPMSSGNRTHTIAIDITDQNAPETIQANLERLGCYCDILVNNAGIGASGHFIEENPELVDQLCKTNITAPTALCRQFLPAMIERQQGGIINIASLGGAIPGPYQAAYYASKSYLIALSEALAHECVGSGVRVCAVLPGPVATTFHADMNADQALYRKLLPELTPAQIARASVRGFRWGKRIVVPGLLNKVMYLALRFLPHALTVPVVAILLRNPVSPNQPTAN